MLDKIRVYMREVELSLTTHLIFAVVPSVLMLIVLLT